MPLPTSKLLRLGKTLLVLLWLCANLSLARAQPEGGNEDHATRGLRFYQQKRFEETIVEWEQALKEAPGPDIQFSLARVYFQLGRYPRALELYTQFLLDPGTAPIDARIIAQRDRAKCEEIIERSKREHQALPTPSSPSANPPASDPSQAPPTAPKQPDPPGTPPATTSQRSLTPAPPVPALTETGPAAKMPLARPLWRVVVGAAAIGAGLIVGGFGVGALAVDGSRVEPMDGFPAGTLRTTGLGAGLLTGGLLLTVGGAVLIAIPQKSTGHTPPPQLIRSTLQGL